MEFNSQECLNNSRHMHHTHGKQMQHKKVQIIVYLAWHQVSRGTNGIC
jgi:hypothetical protein